MTGSSQSSLFKTVTPTPVTPPTPIPVANRLNPLLSTSNEIIQAIDLVSQEDITKNSEQALSTVINLNPATNFTKDTTKDHAQVDQLSALLSLEQTILNANNTNSTSIVSSPSVVNVLSPIQYGLILQIIVSDITNRFGITIDPTKLIYKMLEGKIKINSEQTSGIEISTTSTTDFIRIRFYFSFKQTTNLKFINIYHDQNYTIDNDSSSFFYLYEGSVSKTDFRQLIEVLSTQSYQSVLPSNTTALIPETGTVPMFLAEDMVPIVLEH